NSPDKQLEILTNDGVYNISWRKFADDVINFQLKSFNVAEDRLIGPFFLNKVDLGEDWSSARSALCGKLFVYLWDDVLRHKKQDRNRLFSPKIKTFGELHSLFMEESVSIFSDEIDKLIIGNGTRKED
ncbi:hypothetical protein CGG86_23405, partial [Vibrio parahaemolyticus]